MVLEISQIFLISLAIFISVAENTSSLKEDNDVFFKNQRLCTNTIMGHRQESDMRKALHTEDIRKRNVVVAACIAKTKERVHSIVFCLFFSETASKKLHAARHTCLALQGKKGRYLSNAWTYFSRSLTQFQTCAKNSQQFQYSILQFPVISTLLTCAVNSHLISNIIFYQCYLSFKITVNKIYHHVQKCLQNSGKGKAPSSELSNNTNVHSSSKWKHK